MFLPLLKIIQSAACSLFSLFAQSAATRCSPPPLRANKPSECKHRKITVLSWDAEMLGKFFSSQHSWVKCCLIYHFWVRYLCLRSSVIHPWKAMTSLVSIFQTDFPFFSLDFGRWGDISPQCHPNGNGYPGCCWYTPAPSSGLKTRI